jgi:flagellar biosynthetic protein FlhB
VADPQKTEQPTRRRIDKARAEGSFAVSRDVLPAVQLLLFGAVATAGLAGFAESAMRMIRSFITAAFQSALTPSFLSEAGLVVAREIGMPFVKTGVAILAVMFAAQMAMTRMGWAGSKLMPDFNRLNPVRRLAQLPSQGIGQAVHALVLLPLLITLTWYLTASELDQLLAMPLQGLPSSLRQAGGTVEPIFRKVTFVILAFAAVDYTRQYRQWMGQLRMSKQEIRDEHKESEGNPQVKSRIRQLQRTLLRRRMMSEVDKATAVVVNPTHFAVAIRYVPAEMRAPKVVAKGKNFLALRIRERAVRNQVPIVENPPLARALYKAAEVGQEIPSELYRAVAEVLAYIFRLMHGHRPATS